MGPAAAIILRWAAQSTPVATLSCSYERGQAYWVSQSTLAEQNALILQPVARSASSSLPTARGNCL
jgi:hypothetical protein